MPIYEYECGECGERVELLQRLGDPPPEACAACGGAMRRLVSAPAFQFKGSGWYVTDYAGRKADTGGDGKGDADGKSGSAAAAEGAAAKAPPASAQPAGKGGAADGD